MQWKVLKVTGVHVIKKIVDVIVLGLMINRFKYFRIMNNDMIKWIAGIKIVYIPKYKWFPLFNIL